MATCEFCKSSFEARPQVKKPRACSLKECQRKRQRSNEKEWRGRHQNLYDTRYHQIRRIQRSNRLKTIGEQFSKCVDVGTTLLDIDVNLNALVALFEKFIFSLGIRAVNKFWREFRTE